HERERVAVRRPGEAAGRTWQARDLHGLAGVEPTHEELRALGPGVGEVREARAVRREARARRALDQWPLIAGRDVDAPDVAATPVREAVVTAAHVDHGPTVRRDLGLRRPFQLEHVERPERL